MKHASLAALYRPQTFAQVTGQEMVTTVLSRAAAEDRVAPAYLLSGTRGVGKTTIARILAKALNCVHAPGPEPCNQCDQCRKITQGNHVDVTEIDGASNNSVEDARALRENIGYAPMEGRYKVFIIDEAHMLSRSAFNALLKTLEEPPPRVVFVFATTEAHKFPITIVSRCQHFIFKRLPEEGLVAHLTRVLTQEGTDFDPVAVRLLARRAAGSVRDSMSLLGQTLALGGQKLSVEATRSVLGLAGQDLFAELMESLAGQDCLGVTELMRRLMDQGVDIGFFLRELTALWRTLFLLRQAGSAVLPSLGLPEEEAKLWLAMAPRFTLAHIHAAWHMTLEAQRKVIHSPEPATALELLLLNLALMPRLLPLERVERVERAESASSGPGSPTPAPSAASATPPVPMSPSDPAATAPSQPAVPTSAAPAAQLRQSSPAAPAAPRAPQRQETRPTYDDPSLDPAYASPFVESENPAPAEEASPAPLMDRTDRTPAPAVAPTPVDSAPAQDPAREISAPAASAPDPAAPTTATAPATPATSGLRCPSWDALCTYISEHGKGLVPAHFLRQTKAMWEAGELTLTTESASVHEKLEKLHAVLQTMVGDCCGREVALHLVKPTRTHKTEAMLREEFAAREELQPCLEILDASVSRVRPLE